MIRILEIRTGARTQMLDVTAGVKEAVAASGVQEGLCIIYVPHTTAAVTINEGADPSVAEDILNRLAQLAPVDAPYHHREGNADAHIKAALLGPSQVVPVKDGRLVLGSWQSVFFCEFDGPRRRRLVVQVV
ncbi:MAG: secondary thiamine-phosphate synthase enzyme YjbQ [Bacillota bacterium]|jgi:secondary thiamine-phosphate synthase enzyme